MTMYLYVFEGAESIKKCFVTSNPFYRPQIATSLCVLGSSGSVGVPIYFFIKTTRNFSPKVEISKANILS